MFFKVRLAYEQGSLTTDNPNTVQRWALMYYLLETDKNTRATAQDRVELLGQAISVMTKNMLWIWDPQRHQRVMQEEQAEVMEESLPISPDEFGTLDSLLSKLESGVSVSAQDMAEYSDWV